MSLCAHAQWDIVKSKVQNFAQHTWEVHVKARGANLDKLKTARNRTEDNLNKTSLGNPNQGLALDIYRSHNLALEIVLARDLEERNEAANANWICPLGNLIRTSSGSPGGITPKSGT